MEQRLVAPQPSLTNLCRCIFKFIANHPLMIAPLITHPLTDETIGVSTYRLYDGIELRSGLTCSIFAYPGASGGIPTPTSKSVSAHFMPYDLGNSGVDMAMFHVVVKFSYNEVVLGQIEDDQNLIQVPTWATYGIGQKLHTSNSKKNVTLEINPGIEIIQDYLSVTKLIIDDPHHRAEFALPVNSIEMVSQNVKSKRWESDDTIYFQEGVAIIKVEAYVGRGWRDNLDPLYLKRTNINPTIN